LPHTDLSILSLNASSLCKIFLSLLTSDLDLLFFTTAAELIGLEGVLGLELGSAVLWDVSFRHVCAWLEIAELRVRITSRVEFELLWVNEQSMTCLFDQA
jgi:hypothetical protein